MFDDFRNFDSSAMTAVRMAQEEAGLAYQEVVSGGHLLLGVVKEGVGLGARILQECCGIDFPNLRRVVRRSFPHGKKVVLGELPYSDETVKVFRSAQDYSRECGHTRVGTAHLSYALASVDGFSRKLIISKGLTPDRLHAEYRARVG